MTTYEYPVQMVQAGHQYSVFLSVTGEPYIFGEYSGWFEPTPIYSLGGHVTKVSTGSGHTLFLTDTKQVYGSGYNPDGELGIGSVGSKITPTLVTFLNGLDVVEICAGGIHSLFLLSNGSAYSTGYSNQGSLGLGDTFTRWIPTLIPSLSNITAITAGRVHSLFLNNQGQVFSCGTGTSGQLGLGDFNFRLVPTLIPMFSNIAIQISATSFHSIILTADLRVWTFGANSYGQLGLGDLIDRLKPTLVPLLNGTIQINAGGQHNLFLHMSGAVYGTGDNSVGQLGNNTNTGYPLPILIPPLQNIVQIEAALGLHSLFLNSNGQVFATGRNNLGQLGLGDTRDRRIPELIPFPNKVVRMAASDSSYLINACPPLFSGFQCELPVCFGLSARDLQWTCGGQGVCIGTDQCQCTPPSFGSQCEFSEYHWKGFPGDWQNFQQWFIKKGEKLINTVIGPIQDGHSVYFDIGTSVLFDLNLPRVSLATLSIGSTSTIVKFSISGSQVSANNLVVHPASSMSCTGSTVKITSTSSIGGNSKWSGCNHQGNWMIPSGATFQLMGGTLESANFEVYGVLNLIKGAATSSTITIRPGGIMNYNDTFQFDSSSQILNSGLLQFGVSETNLAIHATIVNSGIITISGRGILSIGPFSQTSHGLITLDNSALQSDLPISITNGRVNLRGTIITPHFNYSSTDEVFRIGSDLTVIGNVTLHEAATCFLTLYSDSRADYFNVTGNLLINSFILLSLATGYHPSIGDKIPFVSYGSWHSDIQNIYLIGAPFKNAKFAFGYSIGLFEVVYSFGSLSNLGYQCH